jgi:hypothetical protein
MKEIFTEKAILCKASESGWLQSAVSPAMQVQLPCTPPPRTARDVTEVRDFITALARAGKSRKKW